MFAAEGKSNYDDVLAELLRTFHEGEYKKNAPLVGGALKDGLAAVPLFGEESVVRKEGIFAGERKIDTIGSILVIRYLMTAGDDAVRNAWRPYRDFKDGSQFASYVKANIEDKLAQAFASRKALLQERVRALGAIVYRSEARPDVAAALYPFPKIPLLILFWDKDDEFDAALQFLFDESAPSFLDMESLAVLLEYTCLKLKGEA